MDLVSVISPIYNGEGFIKNLFSNVQNQTYKSIEHIIINDGSTDQTRSLLEQEYKKYSNVKIFSKENEGPGVARNYGVSKSKNNFIAFLDVDDLWVPTKIEKQMQLIGENPNLGMVSTRACYKDLKSGKIMGETALGSINRNMIAKRLMTDGCFILTSSVLIKKAVFVKIGGFDESLTYAEDWDLFFRIANKFNVGYVNEILSYNQTHRENLTGDEKNRERRITDERKVCDKIYTFAEKYQLSNRDKKLMFQKLMITNARRCIYDKNYSLARKFLLQAAKYNFLNIEILKLFLYIYLYKCVQST